MTTYRVPKKTIMSIFCLRGLQDPTTTTEVLSVSYLIRDVENYGEAQLARFCLRILRLVLSLVYINAALNWTDKSDVIFSPIFNL